MTLALHGKSRKRQGGLLLAALLALIAATLGGLALFSSALAGTPNSGNKSNLQGGQALFSNVTVSKASTMSCTAENSATSFGTSMTFTLSATSPANAYFVLYLSANGGSDAAPAGNVSNNEVQVPVGGLAAGTHTVPVTLPVTSAFTETKGGVLIVISDDTSGTLFNAKSNSLNCTEATPNGNIVVKKVGNFSAGLVAGGFSGPVTGPDGFSTTWTADVGGSDSISVVPGTGYGVSEDTTGFPLTVTGGTVNGATYAVLAGTATDCSTGTFSTTAPASLTVTSGANTIVCVKNVFSAAQSGAPSVSKTQDATPFDATNAYWDITVNNSANSGAMNNFTITDAGTTLISATGGTCTTVGAASPFTCSVAAGGTLVVKVSRPLAVPGAVFDACKGTTIDNNSITLSNLPPGIAGITPTYTNTLITVPADTTKCAPPTITKTAVETPTTATPSWTILVTNPTAASDGITRSVVITDSGVTAATPVVTGTASCTNTGNIASTGITCSMPAGSTVTITVTLNPAPSRQCLDAVFNNTASLFVDGSTTAITGVGNPITLTGDSETCLLPHITKVSIHSATSLDPEWDIFVTNPAGGTTQDVIIIDAGATVVGSPTLQGGATCTNTANLSSTGITCTMPAGSTVVVGVALTANPPRLCNDQQFSNTANLYIGSTTNTPITAVGDTVTLRGDTTLCTGTTFDKTDSLGNSATVDAGTPFSWTMKATVSGSATTADQTFSDTIPNTYTIVSVTPDASITCAAPVANGNNNVITCTLHSGAAVGDHTVVVSVLPGTAACGPFTNTVLNAAGAPIASDREITIDCASTIVINKTTLTNGLADGNNAGWSFTVSSVACAENVTLTTAAGGTVSASVPPCNDYVVTENTASPPVAGYVVLGTGTQTGIVVPAGGTGTANFTNVRQVNPGCQVPGSCTPPPPACTVNCTPVIIVTPTPTPVIPTPTPLIPTPTKTATSTPTATPTNVNIVEGARTPGPGSTPLAPSTGNGSPGNNSGGFNALLAAIGLLALTAGFGVLGLSRKERN